MFGHLEPPVPKNRRMAKPLVCDVQLPSTTVGKEATFGYYGRRPQTDYHWKIVQYKTRQEADFIRKNQEEEAQKKKERFLIKCDTRASNRRFKGEVLKRVKNGMAEYDAWIEKRRWKLNEMLAVEERAFIDEAVDLAQRGGETRMEEMKEKAKELAEKRELERQKVVEEKRLQQYMNRCLDLRDKVTKQRLIESKYCQLQQMRENEARREGEREIEKMWAEIAKKEDRHLAEREEQDAIRQFETMRKTKAALNDQIRARELMRKELERLAKEEQEEMKRTAQKLKEEELEALREKERKRVVSNNELEEQIQVQKQFMAQRKEQEQALENAFNILSIRELEREKALVKDTTTVKQRETRMYLDYLKVLEQLNAEENRQLEKKLEECRQEIEAKKQAIKCKYEAARKKLFNEVMKGRGEQVELKKRRAEEEAKLKAEEEQFLIMCNETNKKLDLEQKRREKEAQIIYQQDLKQQIQYKELQERREEDELQKQLDGARHEEDRYQKMIQNLTSGEIRVGMDHPFRRVLERVACLCDTYQCHQNK